MEFKIATKVYYQKQYNWKFWFKLIFAIIPVASAIIFLIAQGVYLFKDPHAYWVSTLGEHHGSDSIKVQSRSDLFNMTSGQMGAYLFCRNILMVTTLGNFLSASWFINSAVNNKYEGQGKYDNRIYGTMAAGILIFIVLFYNLSLIPSHEIFHHMHWYNWMSWFAEHMIPGLAMIVYFLVFYPKRKVGFTTTKLKEWFIEMGIAIAFVVAFNIFFIVLGFILRAAHATRVFGEMSWSGYFPYPFMNFLDENKQSVAHGSWVKPWMEFVVVMIVQLLEQILAYACISYQNHYQQERKWMY